MTLVLNDDFSIDIDPKNYTLKQKTINRKTGKDSYKIHGYFSRLDSAIAEYIRIASSETDVDYLSLYAYVDTIKRICDDTVQKIKVIFDNTVNEVTK